MEILMIINTNVSFLSSLIQICLESAEMRTI